MRIYEDHRSPDEWSITSTLKLEDDGKFLYEERWTCYWGNAGGGADGRWRQSGATIFLHTERAEGNTYLNLLPGHDRIAVEQGDIISFSEGLTYRLRQKATRELQQPEKSKALSGSTVSDNVRMTARAPASAFNSDVNAPPKLSSPELAARIRRWIDELGTGVIAHFGKRWNILPLHTNSIYMWALNLDGVVVWLDHEAFSDLPEPETDPLKCYAVMVHGTHLYRELAELIPPSPEGACHCRECGGIGWKTSLDEATESCSRCRGFGWYMTEPTR